MSQDQKLNVLFALRFRIWVAGLFMVFFGQVQLNAADFPKIEISNGQIKAKIYLPDAQKGYYRSTRFDWSGAIYSLQYKGHDFYGPWFDRIDPKVINWVYQGSEIVSGPCSALYGPVDEFDTVLGWDESKLGGTFIKIGVGVLRRNEGEYDRYKPYEVLNSGKWSVKEQKNSVEFIQELSDPSSGYAYLYRKVVRLVKGKPEMVIEHSLKNTGKLAIQSSVYNHNFLVLDNQAPGPDFMFKVPYQIEIQASQSPDKLLAEAKGNEVIFLKQLSGEEEAVVRLPGFSNKIEDTEIIIENKKVGAGMKITGDRPLIQSLIWSIRKVLAVEPYISIEIQPDKEFTWKNMYEYYTLPVTK